MELWAFEDGWSPSASNAKVAREVGWLAKWFWPLGPPWRLTQHPPVPPTLLTSLRRELPPSVHSFSILLPLLRPPSVPSDREYLGSRTHATLMVPEHAAFFTCHGNAFRTKPSKDRDVGASPQTITSILAHGATPEFSPFNSPLPLPAQYRDSHNVDVQVGVFSDALRQRHTSVLLVEPFHKFDPLSSSPSCHLPTRDGKSMIPVASCGKYIFEDACQQSCKNKLHDNFRVSSGVSCEACCAASSRLTVPGISLRSMFATVRPFRYPCKGSN